MKTFYFFYLLIKSLQILFQQTTSKRKNYLLEKFKIKNQKKEKIIKIFQLFMKEIMQESE